MTTLALAGGIAAAGCLAGFLGKRVWNRLGFPKDAGEDTVTAEAFSAERYRPMQRLLQTEELRFLESQPGYTPEIGAAWIRGRRKIFRMYLDELKRDFRGLHAKARALVAESGEESSELVGVLIQQQVVFWWTMARVEVRFALAGANLPVIDIHPMLELLDAMRLDLERLAPQAI